MSNDQKLNPKTPLKLFLISLGMGIITATTPMVLSFLEDIFLFDDLYSQVFQVLIYSTSIMYVVSIIYILFRSIFTNQDRFMEGDSKMKWFIQFIVYFAVIPILITFASFAILFSTMGEIRF